jgi:hypothetical protein
VAKLTGKRRGRPRKVVAVKQDSGSTGAAPEVRDGQRKDGEGHAGPANWKECLGLLTKIEAKYKPRSLTCVQIPCDGPDYFIGIYGSAPVVRGTFKVRLSDGRTVTK